MERQIEKYFQEELNADERLDFLKQVESDNELKKNNSSNSKIHTHYYHFPMPPAGKRLLETATPSSCVK